MPSEENFEIPPAHPPTHQPLRSRTHLPPGTPARNPRGAAGPRLAPRACSRTRCTSPPPRLTRPFYPFGHWISSRFSNRKKLPISPRAPTHFSVPLCGKREQAGPAPGSRLPPPPRPPLDGPIGDPVAPTPTARSLLPRRRLDAYSWRHRPSSGPGPHTLFFLSQSSASGSQTCSLLRPGPFLGLRKWHRLNRARGLL